MIQDTNIEETLAVDESKIRQAYQSGMPLTISTYTLPRELEVQLEQVISIFLSLAGRTDLRDYLTYCVQELATNAKKANTKRVYFQEKGLDLNVTEDYKKGMANFKKDTLGNIAHYLDLQKAKGLYIKIILLFRKDAVQVEVRNNSVATRTELIRIHDKLARSRAYTSMEDAFAHVLDDSEGAGLGLVVLALMIKKMGLKPDAFSISATDTETIAKLVVPFGQTSIDSVEALTEKIVAGINIMPQFPDNIRQIQQLIADPKSGMNEIARRISTDPSMTADLIKLVNSAQYMMVKRIDSITQALTIVGIKGIRNLLYSYGTQKVLGGDEGDMKALWNHCYKTAFYAYNLAKNFRKDPALLDDAYLGGMLHDMGQIVLSKAHPDLIQAMTSFCAERAIPTATFEDIVAGMNHAEIGAMVAERWNFPASLVAMIRFHHDPTAAPDDMRPLVDLVYMANMFCAYERGTATFFEFDATILGTFGISTEEQVKTVVKRFSAGFDRR